MTDQLVQWFIQTFGDTIPGELTIFIISILPVLELRGGIIAARILGIDMIKAFFICGLGTILPVPFIVLFIRQIVEWMKNTKLVKLAEKIEKRAEKKSGSITKYKTLGLLIFVAIPLPGTGAWTGSIVAGLMRMRFKYAMISIVAGSFIADIIMCCLAYGVFGIIA